MVKKRKLGEAFLYGFLALFSLLVLAPCFFKVIQYQIPPQPVQQTQREVGSKNH